MLNNFTAETDKSEDVDVEEGIEADNQDLLECKISTNDHTTVKWTEARTRKDSKNLNHNQRLNLYNKKRNHS